MTPGMLDTILEFHLSEMRRTFGQTAAAAGNVMRSSNHYSPYDFFPDPTTGGKPRQTVQQQVDMLRKLDPRPPTQPKRIPKK